MAHILIIDDESNIRMMLKLALTHVGHNTETTGDGYEGLERFASGADWDLVLLDQRMPGMEGLEVLREMRRRDASVRVVMITAFGTIDLATEAIGAGATDFLRKPFTVDTLRASVAAALAGRAPQKVSGDYSPTPHAFDSVTVNGLSLHSAPGVIVTGDGGVSDTFTITAATGEESACLVTIPCYVIELVKAHADLDEMPNGERFWQALCGEALANYLWQNAEPPPNGTLVVEELTSGLRHWVDAVLSAVAEGK